MQHISKFLEKISELWVIVAHPDDETIFFGGLIQRAITFGVKVKVICVTNGNNIVRKEEFFNACKRLCSEPYILDYLDSETIPLPINVLGEHIKSIMNKNKVTKGKRRIVTHGVWGEYGHNAHIEVAIAVSKACSGNCLHLAGFMNPTLEIPLSKEEYNVKKCILNSVYISQSKVKDWSSELEHYTCNTTNYTNVLITMKFKFLSKSDEISRMDSILELPEVWERLKKSFKGFSIPSELKNIPSSIWQSRLALVYENMESYISFNKIK